MLLPQEIRELIRITEYSAETGPSVDWIVNSIRIGIFTCFVFPELPSPKQGLVYGSIQ